MTATWITPAPPAAPRTRRMVSDSPVLFVTCHSTSADTDGVALLAAMQRNRFSEVLLLARREALASTARHLRNQMRTREASLATDELRAVTNAILAQGGMVMGMFDYVDYRGPLPKTIKPQSRLRNAMLQNLSQSKSMRLWETDKWGKRAYEEGCVKITVTEVGQLVDPDGENMSWTGSLRFYGRGAGHRGWEFTAYVVGGKVEDVVRVRS